MSRAYYKQPRISIYLRNDAALSGKNYQLKLLHSGPLPLFSKSPKKFVQISDAQKLQFIGQIFVADS